MKPRLLLTAAVTLALLGVAGWAVWRLQTTPTPPAIALEGVSKEVTAVVEKALADVRREPRSGKAWGKLSMALIANSFYVPADECLRNAERLEPRQARWPCLRGVLILNSNPGEGAALMRRALALTSAPEEQAAILFRLATSCLIEGQLAEADELLRALQQIEESSFRLDFGLGVVAAAREDWAAVRKYMSRLTDHPCARKQALTLLAAAMPDDSAAAQEIFKKAALLPADRPWPDPYFEELRPYQVTLTTNIARFTDLQNQGRNAEALEFLRQVAARTADSETYYALGVSLFRSGQLEPAAEALRNSVALNPRHVKAQYLLAEVLLREADKLLQDAASKNAALDVLRQTGAAADATLKLQSDHGLAHLVKGRVLRLLGRNEDALVSLREAVLCRPELSEVHLQLGEALGDTGHRQEGLQHLRDAVRLAEPDEPRPREALERWQRLAQDREPRNDDPKPR